MMDRVCGLILPGGTREAHLVDAHHVIMNHPAGWFIGSFVLNRITGVFRIVF
jgi:hypothetical protein